MLNALQAAQVAYLDSARAVDVPDTLLVPLRVAPYGNELMDPDRLVTVWPQVMVELDLGDMERQGTSDLFSGRHRVDLVCIAANAVSYELQMSDGARLMAWVLHTMRQAELVVDGEILRAQRFTWARIGTDDEARLWTSKITVLYESIS